MPKLTKEQSEAVEHEALRLYDKINPRSDVTITISKADCIKQARAKLFPRHS